MGEGGVLYSSALSTLVACLPGSPRSMNQAFSYATREAERLRKLLRDSANREAMLRWTFLLILTNYDPRQDTTSRCECSRRINPAHQMIFFSF